MVFFIFIQVLIENSSADPEGRTGGPDPPGKGSAHEIIQANSGDPDQMPHSVASDLGLCYLPMSHKKIARHIWVKKCNYFAIS